jgi:hypothetical protein
VPREMQGEKLLGDGFGDCSRQRTKPSSYISVLSDAFGGESVRRDGFQRCPTMRHKPVRSRGPEQPCGRRTSLPRFL